MATPAFDVAVLLTPELRLHSFAFGGIAHKANEPGILSKDINYGGAGRIAGTVKEDASPVDLPLRRRVLLCVESTGLAIRETWSDAATGSYSFENISTSYTYFVVAFDYEHNYRAVIADNLQPELM